MSDLVLWRRLCEWLDGRRRKCAYASQMPEEFRRLVYIGGNRTGAAAHAARVELQLIFYSAGWGWRLRKNWRGRLAELEAEGDR